MIYYLGFQYVDRRHTTTGEPHPHTGRMSKAGFFELFRTKKELKAWIDAAPDKIREAVSKREAKNLKAGWSQADFDNHLETLANELE